MASNDSLLDLIFYNNNEIWEEVLRQGIQEKHIKPKLIQDFCDPDYRENLRKEIAERKYKITPPHAAQIPKDDGTMRTIYVNEAHDRVLLSVINNTICKHCMKEMVNPKCVSYKQHIGCGKIDKRIQKELVMMKDKYGDDFKAIKLDLSKYFDTVNIESIDEIFDILETKFDKSCVLDMLKEYYHDDTIIDLDKSEIHKYTSLRQGCAFAAFLADSILKDMDDELTGMGIIYYRYSDDILIMGKNDVIDLALERIKYHLNLKGLSLNPKKVETLFQNKRQWFTFLGFNISMNGITLSNKRIKNLQHKIDDICKTSHNPYSALKRIYRYLYDNTNTYAYMDTIMPVVTSRSDLHQIDMYICDRLKAKPNEKIGGLGCDKLQKNGVVMRGKGRHMSAIKAREKLAYTSIVQMYDTYNTNRNAYKILCNEVLE